MSSSVRERWRAVRTALAPPYWQEVLKAVGTARTVLDVGCGTNSPLARGRERFERLVGVDAFPEAIAACKAIGAHDEVLELDVRGLDEAFEPDSFDAVVAVDLLEHLDHADGARLLATMEEIARQRVVVFTPNGYVEQTERGGNPFQVHRSGWSTAELRERGYRVSGIHGLRVLRAEEAAMRLRPERVWSLVSDLTQPVARRLPVVAFHLLAVKEVAQS